LNRSLSGDAIRFGQYAHNLANAESRFVAIAGSDYAHLMNLGMKPNWYGKLFAAMVEIAGG
jgi:hypothetical protein